MKFTKIRPDTFQSLQMNAGVIASDFDVATASVDDEDILGATSGGVQFTATPEFQDFGEDVDNCPKNMLEMKKLISWEAKMSGTFVAVQQATAKLLVGAVQQATAKLLVGAGDLASDKITPRNDLATTDFTDVWWIGDYTDKNTGTNAGYIAIHLMNALSTGGFQIQSADKGKGQFAFEFTGHYSMSAQDTVPFEIYVKEGTA